MEYPSRWWRVGDERGRSAEKVESIVASPGDKVRVKEGPHKGARGIVHAVSDADLTVTLDCGETVAVEIKEVTNYSLAARKAWQTMPARSVGRPRAVDRVGKKTVSIRVDPELWRLFGEAAKSGKVQSREHAINAWISVYVDRYLRSNKDRAMDNPSEIPGLGRDGEREHAQT